MTYLDLYEKIFAALRFIARGHAIPDQIIANAAEEAATTIHEYIKERNLETSEAD